MDRNASEILSFWFDEAGSKRWFAKSDAFDAEIRQRFEDVAIRLAAEAGDAVHAWEAAPRSALALIIALDQFPRNMYRDTPAAFAWDKRALPVANRMVDRGDDLKLSQDERAFAYMPFMHSEDLADQDRCVELMDARLDNESNLRHAIAHRNVIRQFGRFPHRNIILGRESTGAEIAFLDKGGYSP